MSDDLGLIEVGLLKSSMRKMIALLTAAPLVGLATFVIFGGRSLLLPTIVAAFPLLALVTMALRLRDPKRHPLMVALRDDPLIVKTVRRDVRPIGFIKWRLASSHLLQVELAGDERYTLAFPDENTLALALELVSSRATRAVIEDLDAPSSDNDDDDGERLSRRERRKKADKKRRAAPS